MRDKQNISFLEGDTEISYSEPKAYVFVPELSAGLENDNFTSVNLPILVRCYVHCKTPSVGTFEERLKDIESI